MARTARSSGFGARDGVRDDRVLPVTRWVGRLLVPVLAAAFLILYGLPGRTTELFAWTINPRMTPILMGAGYGTGAYFFYRVATGDRWHEVGMILPGIAVFTWFMAVATVLHWENFNHAHEAFVLWVIIYAIVPFLVPAIWFVNRRTDPRESLETDAHLPREARWFGAVSGVVIGLTALVLFLYPDPLMNVWPWAVSPLTSRVLLGWFALFGVSNLGVWFDSRWSAARILVETQVIGYGLLLLGAVRAWSDFDAANPATWAFVGGFVVYLLGLLVLYYRMETHR